MVVDTDNYIKICTIEVDLSHITLTPRYKRNGERRQYFSLDFDLILLFGSTELKAQVAWREGVRVLHFLYSPCLMLTFVLFFCGRTLRSGKPRVRSFEKRICLLIWWNRSPTKIVYDPDITRDD